MSVQRCTLEFKDVAVRQVIERCNYVVKVAKRIGVTNHGQSIANQISVYSTNRFRMPTTLGNIAVLSA